jgi:hypothetical protein
MPLGIPKVARVPWAHGPIRVRRWICYLTAERVRTRRIIDDYQAASDSE